LESEGIEDVWYLDPRVKEEAMSPEWRAKIAQIKAEKYPDDEDDERARDEVYEEIATRMNEDVELTVFRTNAEDPNDLSTLIWETAEGDAASRHHGVSHRYTILAFRGEIPEPDAQHSFLVHGKGMQHDKNFLDTEVKEKAKHENLILVDTKGVVYEARVTAVGPTGLGRSDPSNAFSFGNVIDREPGLPWIQRLTAWLGTPAPLARAGPSPFGRPAAREARRRCELVRLS
jgi:hypothetical protein